MSGKEILEKAIQKAIDRGLTGYWAERYKDCARLDEMEYLTDGNNIDDGHTVESLIFNHDFAKALWGEKNQQAYVVAAKELVNRIRSPWVVACILRWLKIWAGESTYS